MNEKEIQLKCHLKVHKSKIPKINLAPHTNEVRITIQEIKHK